MINANFIDWITVGSVKHLLEVEDERLDDDRMVPALGPVRVRTRGPDQVRGPDNGEVP